VSIRDSCLSKICTGVRSSPMMVNNNMRFARVGSYESSSDSDEDFWTAEDRRRRRTVAWHMFTCFAFAVLLVFMGTLFAYLAPTELFTASGSSQKSHSASEFMSSALHDPLESKVDDSSAEDHPRVVIHSNVSHAANVSHNGVLNATGAINQTMLKQCRINEELYAGLCYKKCALLTNGSYPVRGTAFSCCRKGDCGFLGQKTAGIVPCTGYDVSGQHTCPHHPGECLENEELFFGLCYKKCSVLSNGSYPYRVASATCCKAKGLNCLDFSLDKTRSAFAVGGGQGDKDPATPKNIHAPIIQSV